MDLKKRAIKLHRDFVSLNGRLPTVEESKELAFQIIPQDIKDDFPLEALGDLYMEAAEKVLARRK